MHRRPDTHIRVIKKGVTYVLVVCLRYSRTRTPKKEMTCTWYSFAAAVAGLHRLLQFHDRAMPSTAIGMIEARNTICNGTQGRKEGVGKHAKYI